MLLYRTPSYSSLSPTLRPIRILPLLQFVTNPLWRSLFGRTADGLERSTEQANEYMVIDNDPFVAGYVSYPRELEQLNVCAYVAGIVEGVCSGAGFGSKVTAVGVPSDMWPSKTVYLVRFDQEVMEREAALLKA